MSNTKNPNIDPDERNRREIGESDDASDPNNPINIDPTTIRDKPQYVDPNIDSERNNYINIISILAIIIIAVAAYFIFFYFQYTGRSPVGTSVLTSTPNVTPATGQVTSPSSPLSYPTQNATPATGQVTTVPSNTMQTVVTPNSTSQTVTTPTEQQTITTPTTAPAQMPSQSGTMQQ